MYIFDTREKKNDHIKAYFDRNGIAYRVEKLDVGDYMAVGGKITIDRKASIEEISKNLTNRSDKIRFWNEVRLSIDLGLHLIVLIETSKYREIKDLSMWKSKYSPVYGGALIKEMEKLKHAYNVDFLFCDKRSAGKKIVKLIGGKIDGMD